MEYGDESPFQGGRAPSTANSRPRGITIMTRCIDCTRCIRFTAEVAGIGPDRRDPPWRSTEITTYLNRRWPRSAGRVIDLSPVGALTSKPYAFPPVAGSSTRPIIDVMDAVGSAIRVDTAAARSCASSADERERERGVDLRQDRASSGRPEDPALPTALSGDDGRRRRPPGGGVAAIGETSHDQAGRGIGAIAGDLAAVEQILRCKS